MPAGFDAYVAQVMAAFEVPGLSVSVVKDGTVVLAKGYGVRKLGESTPVDPQTLFGIASNTKVFTAVALALLVEEGRLEWDAPVVRYLPAFQMWDPWVTRELTVRDLLVHRSGLGLGAGDLLWWPPSTYDRKEIVRRLRYLKPATSFRSAYAYDNVLYLVAGELIESLGGQSWEDFVTTRILRKVGMAGSNVTHSAAAMGGNVATPHARVDGKVRPVSPFTSDNTNPAGGINSNADDMARWLQVLLADGRLPNGSRLFSEQTSRQLSTLVTPIPITDPPPELAGLRRQFQGYGLGLGISDYRGRKVIRHGGVLPGYVSHVLRVPDSGLGIAVLTSQESEAAYNAILYRIVDHHLGLPGTDWLSAYQKAEAREAQRIAEQDSARRGTRAADSRPSLPLAAYAGTYRDDWYGDVTFALESERLVIRFTRTPVLVGDLEHWQHDTFVARWRDRELRADAFVTFALDPEGRVEQAKMRAVSEATDFSYDFQDLLLRPSPTPAILDEARQLVLVTTASWDAVSGELRRYERDARGSAWRPVGAPLAIVVGRKGLAWAPGLASLGGGPVKAEGDGRSPAGAFALGVAFGYASVAPSLKLPYVTVTDDLECVDDPASQAYNRLVRRSEVTAPDWRSSERMREAGEAYRWGVVVEYNTRPPVGGRGSCIFLHIDGAAGSPATAAGAPPNGTAGCTAMAAPELDSLMRWLDPQARPILVQLPRSAREALAARWPLPR